MVTKEKYGEAVKFLKDNNTHMNDYAHGRIGKDNSVHVMFGRAMDIKTQYEKENPVKAEEEKKGDDGESSHAEEKKEKVKKEKRKIRLDMHLEQIFVDGNDAYVWIYDPIPYYYWLAGGGVVLAVVALCLFPLWPPVVR